MFELLLDDGSTLIDEDSILQELVIYYKILFSKEPNFEENQDATLRKIMRSTRRVLTEGEIRNLVKRPTKKELRKTLQKRNKEKSPGIDGLTTKVYH